MCGRITLRKPASDVAKAFDVLEVPDPAPRYNVAPSQNVAIVRDTSDGRQLAMVHWGLIPPWADDPKIGYRTINARADSVATKPSFRHAFKKRRCLVVADGFYEWKKTTGTKKQPFHIHLRDDRPFAFAGLWARWREMESCTIITTEPNELMEPIHNRMPVILSPDTYDLWLDPAVQEPERLEGLLRSSPANEMVATAVSTLVNNPRNESQECITPI